MDVKITHGTIHTSDADALTVGLFEGAGPTGATQEVDQALDGAVRDLIDGGDLSGRAGEAAVLYPRGAVPARRVIVVAFGAARGFRRRSTPPRSSARHCQGA